MSLPEKFSGFAVLPLSYEGSSTPHVLYLREHTSRKPHGKEAQERFPDGRTLFAVNVPPDATERELALFFQHSCGVVERVVFGGDVWASATYGPVEDSEDDEGAKEDEDEEEEGDSGDSSHRRKRQRLSKKERKKKRKSMKPPPQVTPLPEPDLPLRTFHHSGCTAHIIFLEPSSLARALSLASPRPWPWPPTTTTTAAAVAPSGLAHYAARHRAQRPALPALKAHADTYMEVFEYNRARLKQKSEYKKGEAVVDEDGFTLVTRGGAYGTTLGGGVGVASKRFMKNLKEEGMSGRRGKKKTKKHEKEGFYTFQRHEERRKKLEDLKANWKKDQEAVAQLSKAEKSRFNPY